MFLLPSLEGQMVQEEDRPPVKAFLEMLADLLAEKCFERMDDRMKKNTRASKINHGQRG